MKHCVWIFLALTLCSYSQTPGNGVTDIDGNIYNSVIIGAQEWTKENLNVSKYSDGTPIPQVTDGTQWSNLTTGAWCYYSNTTANGTTFGKLYNWYAVAGIHTAASLNNPSLRKQIAPQGWHIPSDAEWTTLTDYLGEQSVAGGKMKSTSTLWQSPNTAATNESGFSGLPGGYRNVSGGSFNNIGVLGRWWSSSESNSFPSGAWDRNLYYLNSYAGRANYILNYGISVRLVKNTLLDNQSIKSNSFNIYPNPVIDNVVIDLGNLTTVSNWRYKIVNTLGQEVLKGVLSSQQNIVQLNNLKGHGVYFVKIINEQNEILSIKKIILQ